MKNKVLQFPQLPSPAEVPKDEPVIFTFGEQRFAVQWIVSEVNRKPAEVIPMRKRRQRQGSKTKRTAK